MKPVLCGVYRNGVITCLHGLCASEPEERRGVLREDAEAEAGVQSHRHHPGDDQEEREVQEGAAAPHPGGGGKEVRRTPTERGSSWMVSHRGRQYSESFINNNKSLERKRLWQVDQFPSVCVCVFRYRMGDFSGDTLRAVSLPLVEKPVYSTAVPLSNGSRLKTDVKMKVRFVDCVCESDKLNCACLFTSCHMGVLSVHLELSRFYQLRRAGRLKTCFSLPTSILSKELHDSSGFFIQSQPSAPKSEEKLTPGQAHQPVSNLRL